MSFGVLPQGFSRKPLSVILAELEAKMVEQFGDQVVQTSQSPLGQFNGLVADVVADLWEIALSTYQSFDPNEAEGARLDQIGTYRLLLRGESLDPAYRQAIMNTDRTRIDLADLETELNGLSGVTFARVFVNDTAVTDSNGIPRQHVSVAVIGGENDSIAQAVRQYVVPGIGTYGNTTIQSEINGKCREFEIIRPTLVPMKVALDITVHGNNMSCPPPSELAVATGMFQILTAGDTRPINGEDATEYLFRKLVEGTYQGLEVVEVRVARKPGTPVASPEPIGFFEIMTFELADITPVLTNA